MIYLFSIYFCALQNLQVQKQNISWKSPWCFAKTCSSKTSVWNISVMDQHGFKAIYVKFFECFILFFNMISWPKMSGFLGNLCKEMFLIAVLLV